MERCRTERVIAPTDGVIVNIDPTQNKITTLIAVEDNHIVRSPVDGQLTEVCFTHGNFKHRVFESVLTKKGRATLRITNEQQKDYFVTLEVGKGYVTNRVRIDKDVEETVAQGEPIGEILLGSLSELTLPVADQVDFRVWEGQRTTSGQTALAELEFCSPT